MDKKLLYLWIVLSALFLATATATACPTDTTSSSTTSTTTTTTTTIASTTTTTTTTTTSIASTTTTTTTTTTTIQDCKTIAISARGQAAAGVLPIMQLWIDGKMKAQWTVLADTREYTYDINLCTGGHNVDIVYTNDCSTPTVNRNLYVYYLKVGGKMIESDDIGVKYDLGTGSGAFDGLDVIAGRVFMDWDGALRFRINDGYTTTTTTTSTTTTTMPVNCSMLWWFDNNHPVCNQSQFCGVFAYYGLRTFGTQQQCLDALNATCAITGDYAPCGQVTLQEVIGLINKWAAGSAELREVIGLINAYQASN